MTRAFGRRPVIAQKLTMKSRYCAQRERITSAGMNSSTGFISTGIQCPKEGNGPFGYLWEYGCALFVGGVVHLVDLSCGAGFMSFRAVILPMISSWSPCRSRLFGVKYIFDHHDVNPELYFSKYGKKDCFYKAQVWLENLTYRFSDVVMSTNNSYQRHCRDPRRYDSGGCIYCPQWSRSEDF